MMELLSPAGGMEQLKSALHFGADAVYGGVKRFGLRANAGNFTWEELKEALDLVHGCGKKFYLTLNILPYDDEMDGMVETAQKACEMGVDAAIVSDVGAFLTLREKVPQLPLHVSTQANVMNAASANFFAQAGAERIVLSRELSLERIKALKAQLPENVEIETFVHGAMCMSHSGRCMMSDFMMGRGGNHGACAQPCRWQYTVTEIKRPDEPMEVMEDAEGTYIFSAYDLNMLSHLPELEAAGVKSLKIEGRMKTGYYVATVTQAYRKALDLYYEDKEKYEEALPYLQNELLKCSHRLSNTGFYYGRPEPSSGAGGFRQTMEFTGRVLGMKEDCLLIEVKNRFHVGDALEVLSPSGSQAFTVSAIYREEDGQSVEFVSVAGQVVCVPVNFEAEPGDYLRGPNRNHRVDMEK
ncbi:MAG: U32 family peptidase [Clostridia bacterium]|nr:U32 family peptidase [Clostridia bacterium]